MNFVTPLYLWLLLILIPFIVLRLLQKPKEIIIVPNLNFWLDEKEKNPHTKKYFSLNRLLYYLPLFLLFAFVDFSLANPYSGNLQQKTPHIVIVVDTSVTMYTKEDNLKNRLQLTQEAIIKQNLDFATTTIIVTSEQPRVLTIEQINIPLEKSNIAKALSMAENIKSEIDYLIVYTDGVHEDWKTIVPEFKKKYNDTFFVQRIGSFKQNAGITIKHNLEAKKISINVYRDDTELQEYKIKWGKVQSPNKQIETILPYEKTVPAFHSTYQENIQMQDYYEGWWEFRLEPYDYLREDNRSFCYIPKTTKCKILLLADHNEPELLAALGAYQNLIDENSNITKDNTTTNDNFYDLLITTKEFWEIPDKVYFRKILFWNSKTSFINKQGSPIKNSYTWKTFPHEILQNLDFSLLFLKDANAFKNIVNPLISHKDGEVMWIGEYQNIEYLYASFSIEQSNIALLPSFPVFIRNVMMWSTEKKQQKPLVDQITTKSLSLKPSIQTNDSVSFPKNDKAHYFRWYAMLLAYGLAITCIFYLKK